MSSDVLIRAEGISKKFSSKLKTSMKYGIIDIAKDFIGAPTHSDKLRQNEFWSVQDVSFEVRRGECLGLIGPNGAGKSTLLKMLNGIVMPDKGSIEINGRVGALIEVGAGFHPLLTGRENIYINGSIMGLKKKEIDQKFDSIVEFADLDDFIDTPVSYYSSGMYVRLGFAVAVHLEPDILLVDEVLAVGDEGFQRKCLNKIGKLREKGTAIILVSHNMHTISTFANKVILLNNGKHEEFKNVSEGIKAYRKLFWEKDDLDIQKICNGNEMIKFYQTDINKRSFYPGDTFSISLKYESIKEYPDAEIDTVILSSNEHSLYFQATNKAYSKRINLKKGDHTLKIKIENIQINDALVKIVIAIWSKNKGGYLFWWRIPVEFKGVDYSTGNNFLNVSYEIN